MTKICMLSTGHNPLDDRIYYKEALSLVKRYSPIVIVTAHHEPGLENRKDINFISLNKSGSLLNRLVSIPAAVRAVIKIKPDVCHFHDYELIITIPFIRLFSKCKIIYDVHEVYPEMVLQSQKIPALLRPFLSKAVDITEKVLSRLTDYVIASDDNISKRFSSMKGRVATIYNYPRAAMFHPNTHKVIELSNSFAARTPIIYQGGISEERGLFLMIEAMQTVKESRPDVLLLLVGNMSKSILKTVNRELEVRDLKNHVNVVGWVPHEEVVNYISVSKLGLVPLLPTKKFLKNIPIKQFEYMACGVPVLGANLPPIASYIDACGCGKLFDSTSADALSSGIIDVLSNDLELERMSDAGKKATRELWNWDIMEEKLFHVYEELLESS